MKFFQPLSEQIRAGRFTTKPAGKGTGLGLSLSYDIVKAHGGELKVKTQEGVELTAGLPSEQHKQEGTEFMLQIPV
ncbi:MAG TPA: ATP-binding protein [Draconibacterium sp.]|nr:ATP-binding protein [Draconibacterium sp.]